MKRIFAGLFCALLFALPAHANGNYVEGSAAYTTSNDLDYGGSSFDMEAGYLIGLAIGGTLANSVSVEGELTYSDRDYENYDSSLAALGLMANLYYNFQIANAVGGYFGGGLGPMRVAYDGGGVFSSYSDEEWVFGYQFLIGLTYGMANGVTLFSEYRFQNAQDADLAGQDVQYQSHSIGGGIRADF